MIEVTKDLKSQMWTITTTDSEGFHRQIYLNDVGLRKLFKRLKELIEEWKKSS